MNQAEFEQYKEHVRQTTDWDRQAESIAEWIEHHLPKPIGAKVERFSAEWYAPQVRAVFGFVESIVGRDDAKGKAVAAEVLQLGMLLGEIPGARDYLERMNRGPRAGGEARAAAEKTKTLELAGEARRTWRKLPPAQRSHRRLSEKLAVGRDVTPEALRKRLRPYREYIES